MPFKACLQCELLFEVDERGASLRCTQCGAELADYEPEPWELEQLNDEAEQGETLMLSAEEVASANPSGVVATMAIEGLAEKLRRLAAEKGDPDALLPPRTPAPVVPTPAPVVPTPVAVAPVSVAPVAPIAAQPVAPRQATPRPFEPVAAPRVPTPRPFEPVAPAPRAPTPRPFEPVNAPAPRAESSDGKARATRLLDVSNLKPGEWPDPPSAPAAPVAPPLRQPTPRPAMTAIPTPMPGNRPTVVAPPGRRRRRKSKAGLLIAIVVFLGAAGGGLAAWYFTQMKKAPVDAPTTDAPEAAPPSAPRSFAERLEGDVRQAGVTLPTFAGAPELAEGPTLVGGPDGLLFSEGPIPGLASAQITEAVVGSEAGREFVRPLRAAFERAGLNSGQPLLLAFDRKLTCQNVLRMAWSARLAGITRFMLVSAEGDARGGLEFLLMDQPGQPPADGRLEVRVGRLGLLVNVRDSSDQIISQGEARIAMRADGDLDIDAFKARLDALLGEHAGVREAVLYPSLEMTHDQLLAVVGHLRRTAAGPRYPEVRVVVP